MKRGRKPNRNQRDRIRAYKLDPEKWLVSKSPSGYLVLIHRETGQVKTIDAMKEQEGDGG